MKETIKKIIIENQQRNLNVKKRELELPEVEKVISLIGLRRVGKTSLFFSKINQLIKNGVKREEIIYINFDDERLLEFNVKNFEDILTAYYELYPQNHNKLIYLFLDEIQNIDNWERFVRRLSERKELYRVYLTGSSSRLLSSEIATSLRGRTLAYYLYPLSFKEYLYFNGIELENNWLYSSQAYLVKNKFNQYIQEGGFPELINKDLKKEILNNYIDMIIYKDLIERYNIKNILLIKNLIRFIATNSSKFFSINSYYNLVKQELRVSRETIIEYMGYLEDINFVFLIPKFDYSIKAQQSSQKKIYTIDTGLANSISFEFSEDKGRKLENLVFIELKRLGKEIFYHNQKKECDFVIKEGEDITEAIQVTDNIDNFKTKKREFEGLLDACKSYNLKKGLILTEDDEEEFMQENIKIIVKPIWKWLLE